MSDAATREADRWQVPSIDGDSNTELMTASRLQELQKQAYDEAFEEGRKAGLEAGQAEVAEKAQRLEALLMAQVKPLDELDAEVEEQLVELAMLTAGQLFRREIKIDPGHVVGVVHDAVALLPVASRDVKIQLHPDDATLLHEVMNDTDGDHGWTILEDPLIDRGGCKVSTENSQVDAQNKARLQALIASIAGDERSK